MKKDRILEADSTSSFNKEQLLMAKRYSPSQKDILSAVLTKEDNYTHEQALSLITAYLKKEVM